MVCCEILEIPFNVGVLRAMWYLNKAVWWHSYEIANFHTPLLFSHHPLLLVPLPPLFVSSCPCFSSAGCCVTRAGSLWELSSRDIKAACLVTGLREGLRAAVRNRSPPLLLVSLCLFASSQTPGIWWIGFIFGCFIFLHLCQLPSCHSVVQESSSSSSKHQLSSTVFQR